jgi:hypothetical protein
VKRIAILIILVVLLSTLGRADTQVFEKPDYLIKITLKDALSGDYILSEVIIEVTCHTCNKILAIEKIEGESYYLIRANEITLRHIGHTVEVTFTIGGYMPEEYLIESLSIKPVEIEARFYPMTTEGLLEYFKHKKQAR